MVDRRTVLKLGAVSVAGALVNVPGVTLDAPESSDCSIHRAIFDSRFSESQAFAAEFNARGVNTSPVESDLTQLWYGDLHAQLLHSPAPIAGMTDRATLFCLEELARSVGMKVRYRVDHYIDSTTGIQHDAVGPEFVTEAAGKLSNESAYGRAMAILASRFDSRQAFDTGAQKLTGPFSPEGKTVLVSWVIA